MSNLYNVSYEANAFITFTRNGSHFEMIIPMDSTRSLLIFACLFSSILILVIGYGFDYDSKYNDDYDDYRPRRRLHSHHIHRFQRQDEGFHQLRDVHQHHPHHHPLQRSRFGPNTFHGPPLPPLGPPVFSPPRSLLARGIDLFSGGHWSGNRKHFHNGYGSRHTHEWNTHKWREERYGQIKNSLHSHRNHYHSYIGVNPEMTLLDLFPKLKKYTFEDLKRCYHASYDNEEFDLFHENLGQAFEHFYKYYPENFQEEKHSMRIKNLYKNLQHIAKSIVHCMQNPKRYRVGFTELSDLSEQEYVKLLGAETDPKELLKKYRQKPTRKVIVSKTVVTTKADATSTPGSVQKGTTEKPATTIQKTKVEDAPIAPENHCIPKSKTKLPTEFSWRKLNKTTPAKYQGACGSCWSFAALATIESAYLIRNKTTKLDLSEQDPLRCVNKNKDGCLGGTSMDVFNYILNNHGVELEETIPYNISEKTCQVKQKNQRMGTIDDYCVRGNLLQVNGKPEVLIDEDIQRVVYEFGPVYTTIDSKDLTFKNLLDGVYENANCSTKTNHAVTIVGWDAESWIIKNSWGVRWADKGYFRMKRNSNTCGIRNYITFPIVN